MFGTHLAYNLIRPGDKVLDLGGSAQPFRRADAVVDIVPYDKRESYNSFFQDLPEYFSDQTWFEQDLCEKPLPFKDKEFDFVVCGHLLEDVRDPIGLLREILRVAKRGYIEAPSRFCEQMPGVEHPKAAGYCHHRWFLDVKKNAVTGKNDLVFVFKNSLVHVDKKLQVLPPHFNFLSFKCKPRLNPFYNAIGLVFDGPFDFYEDVKASVNNSIAFMEETVEKADALGSKLWDTSQGFPVKLSNLPSIQGLTTLWELEPYISKRLPLYGKEGKTPEILEYEQTLLTTSSPLAEIK